MRFAVVALGLSLLLTANSQAARVRLEFAGSGGPAVTPDGHSTHPFAVELNSLFGGYATFSGSLTFDSVIQHPSGPSAGWFDVDRFVLDVWLGRYHFTQSCCLNIWSVEDRISNGTFLGGFVSIQTRVTSLGEPIGATGAVFRIRLARPFGGAPVPTEGFNPFEWSLAMYPSHVLEFAFIAPEDGETVYVFGPLSSLQALPEPPTAGLLALALTICFLSARCGASSKT